MRNKRGREAAVIGTIKKNDGFTLLEIVISIAALSMISVFILQMFMASSELNSRAKNADAAIAMAISEIERLKMHDSLPEYLGSVNGGEPSEAGGRITLSFYYDENWRLLEFSESAPANAGFCLKMEITPEDSSLCAAAVNVDELRNGEAVRRLAELTTKKYFPKNTVAVVGL